MYYLYIMDLSSAETLVISLMDKHGLLDKGWHFKYDNAVKRFGVCMYGSKCIGLSKKLVLLNDRDSVKDTILHEIAHAIAGFKAGHGIDWKIVCERIGAKPERCYDVKETNMVELKYHAVCGGCNTEYQMERIKHKHLRRSCKCQKGKDWNDRSLLNFKRRY